MFFHDFHYFYSAAWLVTQGKSPYDDAALAAAMAASGFDPNSTSFGFLTPPWLLWIIFPLGYLSPSSALLLNLVIGTFALGLFGTTASRLVSRDSPLAPQLALFYAMLFFPFFKTIIYGQFSYIPLLAWWIGYQIVPRNLPWLRGALLSISLIKPQLYAPLLLLTYFQTEKDLRRPLFLGLVLGVVAQGALTSLLEPQLIGDYLHYARESAVRAQQLPTPSIASVLLTLAGMDLRVLLWLSGLGISLWISRTASLSPLAQLSWVSCASAVFTPYIWSHDFALLFPAYLFALSRLPVGPHATMLLVGLQFLVPTALLLYPGWEQWLVFYPLIIAGLLVLTSPRSRA